MPPVVSVIIILALLAGFTFAGFWLRFHTYEQMNALLSAGDVDGFLARVDRFPARAVLAPLARERLRFRAFALAGDRDALRGQFNGLMKMKLNDYQRSTLLTDGFNAFAGLGDHKHTARILDAMRKAGFTDKSLAAYQRHFDIVLDHKTEGWKDLENAYATLTGKRRGYVAYLLSKVHENLRDAKAAAAYRREASSLCGIPEEDLDRRIHVNTTV